MFYLQLLHFNFGYSVSKKLQLHLTVYPKTKFGTKLSRKLNLFLVSNELEHYQTNRNIDRIILTYIKICFPFE